VTGSPAPTLSYSFSGATTGSGSGSGSGSAFNVGATTVTLTATNACGNSSCTFTITVNDNQAPTTCAFTVTVTDIDPPAITCPDNISVSNDAGECSAVVTFTAPVGTDNCPGAATAQTMGLASGVAFPVGVTTNTFTVTAANGQTASCSFTVTVTDNEPPAITCPDNISVNNDAGLCSAVVNYTAPVGTDNCPGATTAQIDGLASGAIFPLGVTLNRFRVETPNGATFTCSFTVTVTDNEPPTITCPGNISVNNDAGECSAVDTYSTPVGTDNCSGATTVLTSGLASGSAFR
jgi:hypothetical protein